MLSCIAALLENIIRTPSTYIILQSYWIHSLRFQKEKKNNNKSSVKQYFKMNVTWPKITQYIIICAAWNSYEKFRWIHKTNIVQIFFFKRERNVFINSNKFNNNVNVQRMKFNSNLLQTTLKMYKIVMSKAQMFNI